MANVRSAKAQFDFEAAFRALTGFPPMPWQEALYERLVSDVEKNIPESCNLPTGLGKTSVIAIWLIALANRRDKMPRRLAYVVNRRTVVDQTTDEATKLKDRLRDPEQDVKFADDVALRKHLAAKLSEICPSHSLDPLVISTLRGQFADNRAWSADPSRPAIICGTVDMIGSRLLFSGYGVGSKAKPLHSGFLGQDILLVHDEAHLEPAFQRLIESIKREQERCKEFGTFHVMELTATSRGGKEAFGLSDEDHEHPEVKKRINANKRLLLHQSTDDKTLAEQLTALAVEHKDSCQAILMFAQKVEDVEKIASKLPKGAVERLTGTMRGLERDALVKNPVFQRFLPESNRDVTVAIAEGTVYLVCTSAGEVGVNLSADHLVCDLSTFESMVQRFGRVNRFGLCDDSRIDVVYPASFGKSDKIDALDQRRQATLPLLQKLQGDASPAALEAKLTPAEKQAGFAPEPTILPVTDMLFDAWALTSIRGSMPGRPPVEPYLHGIAEWQPPETHVAWREEVEVINTDELLERYPPVDLLDVYPLKPHELLRDRSARVFKHLDTLAERHGDEPVWVLDDRGTVEVTTLEKLADKRRKHRIDRCTVLLPPSAGGLASGMLDGASPVADDVSDIPPPRPDIRVRVWSDDEEYQRKTANMRRVQSIENQISDDDDEPLRWVWFEKVPQEGGRTAKKPVAWKTHVDDVVEFAARIVDSLNLPQEITDAVILAAELHDHGKRRERFQTTLGNRKYPQIVLAKSGRKGARLPEPFRHEFASTLDALDDPRLNDLTAEMQELVLHLIATHHGRARPHFDHKEAFDPERPLSDAEALAIETPRRFARLQRRYGRWGLAYLESLLRAADWAASAAPSAYADESEVER